MHRRTRFALIIVTLTTLATAGLLRGSVEPLNTGTFVSSHRLRGSEKLFGGFSGIEISSRGDHITLLSDRGLWTQGQINRDDNDDIVDITLEKIRYLRGTGEAALKKSRSDSEGLAIDHNGTAYVSFEGAARVLRYDDLAGPAKNLPTPPEFRDFAPNAALEALAVDDSGALYTLPEDTRTKGADFPIFRFDGTAWSQPFTLPRREEFLPVGADFGPDGRFYLLERAFYGLGGFASRVRAFEFGPDRILSETLILQTPAGRHDNLEGISVWQDRFGDLRLTMVSDDNHVFYLRNQVIEYRIKASQTN